MPRLLPRLLHELQKQQFNLKSKDFSPNHSNARRKKKKSLRKRPLPLPSFSVKRTSSILLDHVNPITNGDYTLHKSLPPRVHLTPRRSQDNPDEYDLPRSMTPEERNWWSSPYLRMLSSPLRTCMVTSRCLPTDFLIRLAPMRLPTPRGSREAVSLFPDGLEHPRFKNRKCGKAGYVVCWNSTFNQIHDRGIKKRLAPNITLYPLLGAHVGHLLRVRVLQELEFLADQLQARPQGAQTTPVIRRLSRAELRSIRDTGIIPFEGAAAIIVVPPVNRDPATKERPKDIVLSAAPPLEDNSAVARTPLRPSLPLATLHTTESDPPSEVLSRSLIPFYNGLTLFPSRSQRAALHKRLTRLLFVERRARYREHGRPAHPTQGPLTDKWARGDEKASHAFLLSSDTNTLQRADAVPILISLWRLRMWEGNGWGHPYEKPVDTSITDPRELEDHQ